MSTLTSDDDRNARRRSRNSVLYETLGADKLLELRGSKLEGPREDEESESGGAPTPEPPESADEAEEAPAIVAVGGPIDGTFESPVGDDNASAGRAPNSPEAEVRQCTVPASNLAPAPKAKSLSIAVPDPYTLEAQRIGSPNVSPHAQSPRLVVPRSPGLPSSPRPGAIWSR